MKSNRIELATEFDSNGEPSRWVVFNTRPTITLSLVYECVSFLASSDSAITENELHQLLDLVIRIYDEQFDKSTLIDGLPHEGAMSELLKQVIFVASGNGVDGDDVSKEVKDTKVNSFKDYKDNLRAQIQEIVKEGGQNVNDVLNMPFYFVFDELNKKAKKKTHKDSMIDAFM
ncbi:hypothetical protein ABDK10_05320 [Staphylococcus aureus]